MLEWEPFELIQKCFLSADAALILMFLHELLKVFTGYFGRLEEESIRDNFVVIHELVSHRIHDQNVSHH